MRNPGEQSRHGRQARDRSGLEPRSHENNVRFLRSVTLSDLDGIGVAFTLTLKNCPATGDDWHKLRRAFLMRLTRAGMSRLHWVTEWQRRGVPHLHGVAYFPDPSPTIRYDIIDAWTAVAGTYGAEKYAQNTAVIHDSLGWLKYLAKHASRGVSHYQRSPDSIPPGWTKTGRVWGHTGDWPVREALRIELDPKGFARYRRMVRNWRYADARSNQDQRRMYQARNMLRGKNRAQSELRGVSEWISEDLSLRMVELLAAQGMHVSS